MKSYKERLMAKIKDKGKEKLIEITIPKKDKPASEEVGGVELSVLLSWYEAGYQGSRKERWQWFVIDQFLRGNHAVRGNALDNSVEIVRKSNSINFPINKVFAVFRAVRGYVTRHKPVVEVEPEVSDEPAKIYARRANAILARDNKLNNFRKINKEWVYYGIKYGVGYRQLGWDAENHMAIRWTVDPFNLIKGDKFGEIEDCPYLIKSVRRTVGYVRNKFPNTGKDIQPDNKLDDDEFKTLSLSIAYNNQNSATTDDVESQTVILYECWYKVFEKNKKGGTVNKCIYTKSTKLHFEETPFNEYPFVPYKADIVPNEANAEGAIKHIIAPQRMLNLLNTQMLEYNHLVNRGRFLKDKNAGFKIINAVEGQIIEKKAGSRVDNLPIPALNPALSRQIDYANDFIEEIGGSHDASRGAVPQRVSSGAAIEAIQTGDSNNIADYRDNFEDALASEAAWILKMYSLYESDGIVAAEQVGEQQNKFLAVGQEAYNTMGMKPKSKKYVDNGEDNGDYLEVLNILPDNQVKVSVYSSLGETKEERLNLMTKLVELGVPLKFLLEYLEFPNTTDIFDRIAQEALGEMALAGMQAGATTPDEINGQPASAPLPTAPNPQIAQMVANLKAKSAAVKG
jgi:hypothetical protein